MTVFEQVFAGPLRELGEQTGKLLTPNCGFPAVDLVDAYTQHEMRAGRTLARVADLLASRNLLPLPERERGAGGAVML